MLEHQLDRVSGMRSNRLFLLQLAFVLLMFTACGSTNVADPVVNVDDSNAEMNDAIARARATFPDFLDNWQAMPNDGASVKFGLPTSRGNIEHIWFQPIKITDTEISGTCGNDPVDVPDLRFGEERTFDRSELTDWMIVVGGKCYGGYTIRVLIEMDPDNAPPLEFVDF